MDNLSAVKNLCNAICNTFYPDASTIITALYNRGVAENAEAKPKDPVVFRTALSLVMGFVESSRSEGGISVSTSEDAIKCSVSYWCREFGLDVDEELQDYNRVIECGSNLW